MSARLLPLSERTAVHPVGAMPESARCGLLAWQSMVRSGRRRSGHRLRCVDLTLERGCHRQGRQVSGAKVRGGASVGADVNIDTIGGVYEAFGRGDVAAILDAVTEDVDWGTETSSIVAPWYGVRHGKDAVAEFFDGFGSTMVDVLQD